MARMNEMEAAIAELKARVTKLEGSGVGEVPGDIEALRAEYLQKFGKTPHHKMKPETIRKALNGG